MDPSSSETSPPSLDAAPSWTFDAFTTFEHELAGLAAKLQRWSSRVEDDASSNGGSCVQLAIQEGGCRATGPDGC